MSASDSQQWYIEEIPAIEQDEEFSCVACDPPVSVESGAAGTAPEASISLDTGTPAMLDTPQSKREVTVRCASRFRSFLLCHLSTLLQAAQTPHIKYSEV